MDYAEAVARQVRERREGEAAELERQLRPITELAQAAMDGSVKLIPEDGGFRLVVERPAREGSKYAKPE